MHDPTTRTVAENLTWIRERRGLAKQELELLTEDIGYGVTRKVIGMTENFHRNDITVRELMAWSAALKVSPLDLLLPADHGEKAEVTGFGMSEVGELRAWMGKESALRKTVTPFEPTEENSWFVFGFDGDTWLPVTAPLTTQEEADMRLDRFSYDPRYQGMEMKVIRRRIVLEEED
jgi:hypothetical protein